MQTAELTPTSHAEMQEARINEFPHFGIPGFEKLPAETQRSFLLIPPSHLDAARPIIEAAISEMGEADVEESSGQSEQYEATNTKAHAVNREAQTTDAIETFRRAEAGDPKAREELMDQRKELLNEDPDPDEILQTILVNKSGNPLAQDTVLEVMLTDEKAESYQRVLDVFKEFRGNLPSADDALKPELQIELFQELTKGGGGLHDRLFFLRHALDFATNRKQQNLDTGLREHDVLKSGELLQSGIKSLITSSRAHERA